MSDGSPRGEFEEVQARPRRAIITAPRAALSAPSNRVLLNAILVVTILILVALIWAVVAVVVPPAQPRTSVERQVLLLAGEVQANPTNSIVWGRYVTALTDADQYAKASDAARRGIRGSLDDAPILVALAQLERKTGDLDAALATADDAVKAAEKTRDRQIAELLAKGISATKKTMPSDDIVRADIVRAEVFEVRGQWQKAVDAYTSALNENERMSDVLAARGNARLRLGDRDGAKADFEAALKYTPDLKAALDGMTQLQKGAVK